MPKAILFHMMLAAANGYGRIRPARGFAARPLRSSLTAQNTWPSPPVCQARSEGTRGRVLHGCEIIAAEEPYSSLPCTAQKNRPDECGKGDGTVALAAGNNVAIAAQVEGIRRSIHRYHHVCRHLLEAGERGLSSPFSARNHGRRSWISRFRPRWAARYFPRHRR